MNITFELYTTSTGETYLRAGRTNLHIHRSSPLWSHPEGKRWGRYREDSGETVLCLGPITVVFYRD